MSVNCIISVDTPVPTTAEIRRRNSEKKRQWRLTRSEEQMKKIRERDARRKRALREVMNPEKRQLEREKDAQRKQRKRAREKEERERAQAMSIDRLLNP